MCGEVRFVLEANGVEKAKQTVVWVRSDLYAIRDTFVGARSLSYVVLPYISS